MKISAPSPTTPKKKKSVTILQLFKPFSKILIDWRFDNTDLTLWEKKSWSHCNIAEYLGDADFEDGNLPNWEEEEELPGIDEENSTAIREQGKERHIQLAHLIFNNNSGKYLTIKMLCHCKRTWL